MNYDGFSIVVSSSSYVIGLWKEKRCYCGVKEGNNPKLYHLVDTNFLVLYCDYCFYRALKGEIRELNDNEYFLVKIL